MTCTLARHALAVVICLAPAPLLASSSTLQLDPLSFVDDEGVAGPALYEFGSGGSVQLSFGERIGDSIPVTVPVNGFLLGKARAEKRPEVRFKLAKPATGELTLSGDGTGVLMLDADVLVYRKRALKPARYELRMRADLVKMGSLATGDLLLISSEEDLTSGTAAQGFHAVIGGRLDPLPPGFE